MIAPVAKNAYSVTECTLYIKALLETDTVLSNVRVSGELSNVTYHGSGHVYFTLKDADAQISCAMFKSAAMRAPRLQSGERVTLTGNISVYAPRGNYQLIVSAAEKEGVGDLYRRFMELKEKLGREGLFDADRKRELPVLPKKIAVVTSPTGAAVRDIVRTLGRRFPHLEVIIVPTVVQGAEGAASIVASLGKAAALMPDVIIVARGGGSIEDLWCFNEEIVVRAVAACPVPVVAGVGHETDTTLVDFVADIRASTPTAAAELSVPNAEGIRTVLGGWGVQLNRSLQHYIDFKRQVLDDYGRRLQDGVAQHIRQKRHEISLLSAQLEGMDRTRILRQGYTLTLREGKLLASKQDVAAGEKIETVFADGRVASVVVDDIS